MSTKLKLNAGMGGGRKSTAKGTSVEFSDFREYMLGDDIRKIDWNAYGRMDKFFVKLFMEEKEGLFHIILDCSKSMDFGQKKKSVLARRIAAMLSYIVLHNLDRVSITTLQEEQTKTTKGMTGRQAFSKILMQLENMTFEGKTDLKKGIMQKSFSYKGIVILISDFFDQNEIEDLVKYLVYKKQEVILIHTLAQEEVEPEAEGTVNLIDIENRQDMKVTVTSQVIKNYKKTLRAFQEHIEEIAKKYQVHYIPVTTEQDLDKFIFEAIRNGQLERL